MKEKFTVEKFRASSLKLIAEVNRIIDDYRAQGYRLTLRQIYYVLVTQNTIPNLPRTYDNLGPLVSRGRLGGLIDWDAIEDRIRVPRSRWEYSGLAELLGYALGDEVDWAYRRPRWEGQDNYVELWVEKDAIASILWEMAQQFHVTQMVNRGYSSQSAMYEAGRGRFTEAISAGKHPVLLYLGDHDPSGLDMVRDIRERVGMFARHPVEVRHIAITKAQIAMYQPPPNPTKITDSRARAYREEHGDASWEVDALPPAILRELIDEEFEGLVDRDLMDAIIAQEDEDKQDLREAVGDILRNRQGA